MCKYAALRISEHVSGMALHEIRSHEEARLARAADHHHVFIVGNQRILWAVFHHPVLRLLQNDIFCWTPGR